MKTLKLIPLAFLIISLNSCSSDDSGMDDNMIAGMPQYEGSFVSVAHPTSGMVTVNKEKTKLSFNNFKTDDGPLLLVYLAKSSNPVEYIDLGELKGIEGNYMYDLPNNVNLNEYKYVVIWCEAFSVSFGHAEIKKL